MSNIRCGRCKGYHPSVADVKACYGIQSAVATMPNPGHALPDSSKAVIDDAVRFHSERPSTPPAPSTWPKVPAGHYALETEDGTKFYRVNAPTKGRWAGWTFVDAQASDDYWPIKSAKRKREILEAIAVDPRAAAKRYGYAIGRCSICNRTLTDEHSIAEGIGPVCQAKLGW